MGFSTLRKKLQASRLCVFLKSLDNFLQVKLKSLTSAYI